MNVPIIFPAPQARATLALVCEAAVLHNVVAVSTAGLQITRGVSLHGHEIMLRTIIMLGITAHRQHEDILLCVLAV